jgi:hypothetical protein
MSVLKDDIAAFERMRKDLEAKHLKEWVVFHKGQFEGIFPNFESAAESAVERFDRGPYLIRQVGAGPVHFGGGMIMRPIYANGPSGCGSGARS